MVLERDGERHALSVEARPIDHPDGALPVHPQTLLPGRALGRGVFPATKEVAK